MKSKWFLIVAVVLAVMLGLTVSMAGCKATTTETTAAKTTAAETTAAKTTAAAETTTAGEPVTITVTSWRTEDIDAWNAINAVFMKAHPNIKVEFKPIKNTEYYAQIGTALETGTGVADVLGLHSFGTGKNIYNGGHLAKLNDLVTGLTDLSAHSRAAWATEDGISYAVPIGAVVHGIYYNKDIFDKYNLKEPKTWSEFIKICDTLKENGETVIAQGSKEGWTLYETGYNDYGCNFYGGEKSRQKLMAGEMKFTDEPFVKAFEAVDSLTKYYPKGYQAIDYVSSQQMFTTGKAAIFIGGSWEIGTFKNMGLDFKLGWFAPPVENEGDKLQYCWNSDIAFAMYKDTPHSAEVIEYLKWLLTPEFGQKLMENLPGFYSYVKGDYTLEPLAQKMLEASYNADLTERLTYEKLSDKEPSGNSLMYEALSKLANKEFTPLEAAQHVQSGLETWYKFK